METIILKIILCSGIVLGLYYLFLAKEKTLTFNRFYLLLGLIFSYAVPFVSIETKQIETEKQALVFDQEIPQQILQTPVAIQAETFDYTQLLLIIYFAVSGILIAKMLYSIIRIKTLKGRKTLYQKRNVVLLKNEIAPFSFLSTIYLSEKYFKDGKIDERIFLHEEIHVKQKHSLDVLFIEVIKAFSWFNPFIYLYKNVMITNHEFIADEEVIIKNENIKNYQQLILNEVLKQQNLQLTHQFNFNNTKKRFIMMTKRNSKFAEAKKYLAIPLFILLAGFFVEKVYAKEKAGILISQRESTTSNPLSNDPLNEYKNELKKYSKYLDDYDYNGFIENLTNADKKKLYNLFIQLTDNQQNSQEITFFKNNHKLKKREITDVQFNEFKDTSKYIVSIDGRKVDNLATSNYKKEDFVLFLKTANPKSMNVQQEKTVILMTPTFYEKYLTSEEIVIGVKGHGYNTVKKDTVSPRKNVDAKLTEIKSDSEKLKENTVLDISTAVEGQAADLVPAEFPGGANQLRKLISGNFNGAMMAGDEGTLKTSIIFIVDKSGKVRDIKTFGDNEKFNSEAYRVIKLANENVTWKPATKDGEAVAYKYKMPLTMNFETFKKTQ